MKVNIEKVSVTIDEHEAIDIINTMQAGLKEFNKTPARDFLELLRANFQSSKQGIHRPQ